MPPTWPGLKRCRWPANAAKLPHVPLADIQNLVTGGIVNAQGGYQNEAGMILGYSCLDEFRRSRESLVYRERISRDDLGTIELFSDGYSTPGDAFGVSSWEAKFAEVERKDPAQGAQLSFAEGSTRDAFADDRTYLECAGRFWPAPSHSIVAM